MRISLIEIVKIGIRVQRMTGHEDYCIGDKVRVISTRNGLKDDLIGTLENITGNQIYLRTRLDLIPIMTESIEDLRGCKV